MTLQDEMILTPTQERAYRWLLDAICIADVVVLRGRAGSGRTSILQKVQSVAGGALLGVRRFLKQGAYLEEALLRRMEEALSVHDLVMVDDLDLATGTRSDFLLDASWTAILGEAGANGKRLVFSVEGEAPWPIRRRGYQGEIG